MSLEQYKDANRKELWEILQIQAQVFDDYVLDTSFYGGDRNKPVPEEEIRKSAELEQFKKNALLRLKSSTELIDKQVKRIAELEEALKLTNDELSKTIDEVNNSLKFNICSSDIDDPDYWDKQTCHENQILLKEQGE